MFGAYQRWCRTTSTRAQYLEKMLEMCSLINDPECPRVGKHRELEKSEIKKSERAVELAITSIQNFMNPFNVSDKDHLYNIASGAPIPTDIEHDILQADEIGKRYKEKFIQDRFVNNPSRTDFFQPIKKLKLKTMEACNKKVSLLGSRGKVSIG